MRIPHLSHTPHQPHRSLPLAVALSLSLFLLPVLVGCRALPQILPPATGAGACVLIQKRPQAAPYVRAAGSVFAAFGRAGAPPTPADLQLALATVPHANLTAPYAALVWTGAVEAYTLLWSQAATPDAKARLGATLLGIGESLALAADTCAPSPATPTPAAPALRLVTPAGDALTADAADAAELSVLVARDFRNWRPPKR